MRFREKKGKKNRISSDEVDINKLKLLEKMCDLSNDIIHETLRKILILISEMFLSYEKDMDEVHLINSEIKKFMIQLKQ